MIIAVVDGFFILVSILIQYLNSWSFWLDLYGLEQLFETIILV